MLIRSPYAAVADASLDQSFGDAGLQPSEWSSGLPDAENGLFIGSHTPKSIFDLIRGEHIVGAEVAVGAVAADWLRTEGVRRWYHFASTAELGPLDRPHSLTAREHMAPGPRLWGASTTEASALIASGFVHALVSAGPLHSHHFALREAQRLCNVPTVGFLHAVSDDDIGGLGFLWGPSHPYDLIFSPTACGAEGTKVMLARLADRLGLQAPIFRGTIEVIPYGVEPPPKIPEARTWLNWSTDDLVFLSIARLDRKRKYDAAPLLIVFAELLRECPKARLVLAGAETEVDYADRLQRVAAELGIADRVEIRPDFSADDKALLLTAADVFIAFSDNIQETYGVAVVEAMHAGLPVIASDFDGFKESVIDAETGILVPTFMQAPAAEVRTLMAVRRSLYDFTLQSDATCIDLGAALQAMRTLCSDASKRQAMGEAGKHRAQQGYDRQRNHARMLERVVDSVRAARAAPLAKATPPIADLQQTFAAFPTAWLSPTTRIERGPMAALAVTGELGEMLGTAHRQQLKKLLAAALEEVPSPLGDLATRLSLRFPTFRPEAVERHLIHFAKYGLLAIAAN